MADLHKSVSIIHYIPSKEKFSHSDKIYRICFTYLGEPQGQLKAYLFDLQPVCTHQQAAKKRNELHSFTEHCQIYFVGTPAIYWMIEQSIYSTSSTCNLESSVKASISCLLIPASIRNIRAPSFIVSVRSSLLSSCWLLTACLIDQKIRKILDRTNICTMAIKWFQYSRTVLFQCRIAAHLGHILLGKNYKVF